MKSKILFPLLVLIVLLVFTAACVPDNPPVDDTPEIATTAPTNPTSAPTALPTGLPTTIPNTAQSPTAAPGSAPSATVPPTAGPTALPSQSFSPTATPALPTPLPGITLQVVNSTNYMDTNGNFHVVGEVKNTGSHLLTQMELTLVIKDSSGKSLLKDNNNKVVPSLDFNPMLTNLAPGETSPFGYTLYAGSGTPDSNSVSVTPSSQNNSDAVLASVEIQHAQMVASGDGSFLISGTVVNKGSQPVLIRDIAAALINSDKRILAAAYSVDYSVFLQSAGDVNKLDTTPFYLRVTNPASQPTAFNIYLDVEEASPPAAYNLNCTITNHYFDGQGVFHIDGTLTNNSKVTLSTKMVAGLYDKNGVVLDAYSIGSPVNVGAGEIIPFDISSFENVNNSADAHNALDHFTVQIDSYYTSVPVVDSVKLATSNDTIQKNRTDWTVTGNVTNTSNKTLSIETVLVGIYDANGVLIAVNYGWILPTGDSIDNGSVNSYNVVVPLDPAVNVTGYTIKTLVKGELK